MSKRNLATSSTPDVRYETDENGTKLIIRKFDIPLPAKNIVQPNILRSPLLFCTPKEKWKYQHDVPEGKIYTRRVHELSPKPQTGPNSEKTNPIRQCSSVSKVLPTVQNLQLSRGPGHKDIIVMAPKELPARLLSKVPTVQNNIFHGEKITLNNVPDNVIANSVQVIDSKLVNGRKVVYLKAFKDISRVVEKPTSKVISETSQCSVEQRKEDAQTVQPTPTRTEAVSNDVNCGEAKSESVVQGMFQNVPNVQQSNSQTSAPISMLRSVLAQKLNVVSHDGKSMANIVSIPSDSTLKNNDVLINTSLSVLTPILTPHSGVQVSSKPMFPPSDSTLKNNDVLINTSLSVLSPILTPHSSVQVSSKPMLPPSDSMLKNNDVLKNTSLAVLSPIVTPHSSVQVSPMLPQTTSELKNSNEYFTGPVRISNLFGCSNITPNVINNSREITLQVNATPKPNSHVLTMDQSKSTSISKTQNNASYQLVSGTSDNMSSGSNSVIHVDDLPSIQETDFVPADSTTPFIVSSSSSTTSVNSNIDNTNRTEAILVMSQGDKTSPKDVINTNPKESSVQSAEGNIACSHESNIVIFNKSSNNLNLTCPNINVIPKQNINYDGVMRRRKIALRYQHDMQKNRVIPRIEKTVELPARKVKVVEISTQTSLFCLLEPGRMVEMFLNEEFKDSKASLQNNNAVKSLNREQLKKRTFPNNNETNMNTENCHFNISSNCNSETNNKIGPPLSKRIRLDESNSNIETLKLTNGTSQNSENECTFLPATMDFQDFIQPHMEGMEKENFIESGNKKMPSNSLPLTCKQSTINSSLNSNGRSTISNRNFSDIEPEKYKEIVRRLFMDFRISLNPDEDGNLPIHNAVMDSDHKQVERQCLVLNGQKQSVNVKNIRKETPLHLAVLCHDLKMVELLLRYKAKVHLSDSVGNTALHMAVIWGNNTEILKALLTAVEDTSIFKEPNDEGYSLLHLCALHNKINEAVILIKKNADVNIRDRKSGRTPLFHAVENANTELSRILLNSGASTTIPNFSGQTPLNASEVTFVLDQVISNPEAPRPSKSVILPCLCQNNNALDTEMVLSQGESNINFINDSNEIELISKDHICNNLVTYNELVHDR